MFCLSTKVRWHIETIQAERLRGGSLISNPGESKATPIAAKVVALLLATTILALPVVIYLKWSRPSEPPGSSHTQQPDADGQSVE